MGIEDGEKLEAKVIWNIFNKIIEYFPNLLKALPIQVQEALTCQVDLTKIEPPHHMLSLKHQEQRIEIDYWWL
jgi:hypothetical protein